MRVDIWSDVVCPWCYIGKRRFEQAVASFAHADALEVVWHSFQLDPSAKAGPREESQAEMLAGKYGMTVPQAQAKLAEMTALAAVEGLEFRFDLVQGGNTIDAHRVLHHALAVGGPALQNTVKERLMRAVFTEGAEISSPAVLATLAAEAGLPGVAELLASDAEKAEVQADIAQAHSYGITGVPFFVLDNRYGISGAQPVATMLAALDQAWGARTPQPLVTVGVDGQACGPDGCAV